jgi:chemotaxis protein histidine kinase CheA
MKQSKANSPFSKIDAEKVKDSATFLGLKTTGLDKEGIIDIILAEVDGIKEGSKVEKKLMAQATEWNELADLMEAVWAIKDKLTAQAEAKTSSKEKPTKEPKLSAKRKEDVEPDTTTKKSKKAKKVEKPAAPPAKKGRKVLDDVEQQEKRQSKVKSDVDWAEQREKHFASMKKRFKETGNPWVEETGCHVFFNFIKKCKGDTDKAKTRFRDWAKETKYDGNVEGRINIVLVQAKQLKAL